MNMLKKRIVQIIGDSVLVPHGILLYELERFNNDNADAVTDALEQLIANKTIVRVVAKHKRTSVRAYVLTNTILNLETEPFIANPRKSGMHLEMCDAVRTAVMGMRTDETDPAYPEGVFNPNKPYTEYGISENNWIGLFEELADDYQLEHTEEPKWLATQHLTPNAVANWLIKEIESAEDEDDGEDEDDEDYDPDAYDMPKRGSRSIRARP